jgi:Lon protease-like protein
MLRSSRRVSEGLLMVNYNELPLFPLHVVLYPDMPLPLHIFEPRYREMVMRCRAENSPFGIVLIESGREASEAIMSTATGTTARITHFEELPDGRMNIEVVGETRFRIGETFQKHPYLSARVEPFWEQTADPIQLQPPFDTAGGLFTTYLKTLFALQGRSLSALQLPQEPEFLSYAIASVLQIPLGEKQRLLEMTATEKRLKREIEILAEEIDAQRSLRAMQRSLQVGTESIIVPVDTQALGLLSSRN